MRAGFARKFIAALLLCAAGQSGMAQVQQTYQAQATRILSAAEEQVLLLVNESAALLDQGRTEAASATAQRALELARTTRMRDVEALALHNLARLELKGGRIEAAQRLLRRTLLLYEIDGNIGGQGTIRLEMADLLSQLGQPEASQVQADAARKLSAAVGDKLGLLNATSLAVQTQRSDPASRTSQVESLLQQSQSQGVPIAEASALRQQGYRAMDDGDLQAAQQFFDRAMARASTALNPEAESHSLLALGELAATRHKLPEALDFYQRALATARKGKFSGAAGNALLKLASLHRSAGKVALMREHAIQANAAFKVEGQLVGQGLVSEALGDAEWMDGRRQQAEAFYREAIKAGETTRRPENEASARLRLASLLRPTDFQAAKSEAERAIQLYKSA
ncbi:MAG: tetratricopeptide repeat protein, partial [Pseudomonadota bacterium]